MPTAVKTANVALTLYDLNTLIVKIKSGSTSNYQTLALLNKLELARANMLGRIPITTHI